MARTSVRPHEGPKALQTLTTLGYRQVRENPRTGALRPHVTVTANRWSRNGGRDPTGKGVL